MPAVLTLAMLLVPPGEGGVPNPRSFPDLQSDIRAALRDERYAQGAIEKAAPIIRLTQLYAELRHDPRLASSPTLQKHKARLWGRLTLVKSELESRIAHAKRRQRSTRPQQVPDTGGPSSRGGAAAAADYGPGLVALIERTIAPEFWDVQGGPGTIFYYRPLRVLVVRATDDVHGRLGGALGGLRH